MGDNDNGIFASIKALFTSSSSSCSKEEDKIKFSDYDITVYNKKREKIFWGTIAICVLYGLIAFALFVACYTSQSIKTILLSRFLPFTAVFIIGTILIVFYLSYQVQSFKPIKIDKTSNYNPLSCPDYWRLEKINFEDKSYIFDSNINPMLFKYRCVMDNKIFDKGNIAKGDPNFRIGNSGALTGDILFNKPSTVNYNTSEYNLYVPPTRLLNNLQTPFNKYVQKQKYSPHELINHSLIMNNYSLLKSDLKMDATGKNIHEKIYKYNIGLNNEIDAKNAKIPDLKFKTSDIEVNEINAKTNGNRFLYWKATIDGDNKIIDHRFTAGTTEADAKAVNTAINLNGRTPIICDKMYPLYLSTADNMLNKLNPDVDANLNRCAYAKACNIAWSDLNCEKYETD